MTRQELLSTARLRLIPNVRISQAHKLRVLLQAPAGARRVVATPAQAGWLTEFFSEPSTVPAALVALLGKRRCPPLREYYELILQCCDAGVLVVDTARADVASARPWPVRLAPAWAGKIGALACVAGVAAVPFGMWRLPVGPLEWIGSLLAVCLLLSLGQLLAACALAGAKCEVRSPRFHWKSPWPHFRVDTDEAVMGGPEAELAVAALRAAPVALGTAAAAWWQPGLLLVLCLGLLYLLAPWGNSAAMQWLRARFGALRFSVDSGQLLESDEDDRPARGGANWAALGSRGGIFWGVWALLWCAWTVTAAGRLFPEFMVLAASWADRWLRHGPWVRALLGLVAAVVLLGFALVAKIAVKRWLVRRKWRAPLGEKQSLLTHRDPLAGATVAEVLKQFVVLQDLSAADLDALAGALQPVPFAPGTTVFAEDDPGDAFYFVVEGELEILKRLPGRLRRTKVIGLLGAGDSFGEIALLENSPRTATVRARQPSRLLRLSRDDFDRLLAQRVGAVRLREVLQNTAFLGRLVHFAGWSFEDLTRFARRCTSVRFDSGAAVLRQGQPNAFFHLVYDGVFEERDGKKVLRRLTPGDYFGESSLLEISSSAANVAAVEYFDERGSRDGRPATTDIVALEEGRCLTMHRSDFLDFFAHDFRISVRMAAQVER